eukprot:TRINITY_DN5024_c0_g1_i1.p2 TRINITY_DN5024_c0_g1~~TRINITY_DN5024_c0_g1_i1.p2  ORF type:complete len:121 (-),score=60.07 TRINITY_DN5024_c0_g1_i1:686-1048(-)
MSSLQNKKKVLPKMSISLKRKTPPEQLQGIIKPISLKKKKDEDAEERSVPPVASVFGEDSSSSDEEEMPAEARMRMRNIGRDTATSSGPNSFGKTKQGFIDSKKLFEKHLQEDMDKVSGE